ncbi:DUF1523 domain-containing protein [Clostridium lacusfryxellense]|uniref:DUF1523 domain-containing protein n=1 Tax=Clostridium lacusfryxellense TaxID=205328 RepID=UPI0028AA2A88|nr:DUF1523 domain-containing protein [Clostridium lacusfryxellense]
MRNISYRFKRKPFMNFKIGKVIIIIIVALGVSMFFPHLIRNTYVVTIGNKRIVRTNNKNTYLIYAQMEDGNIKVFKNTNNLFEFKFHSEDTYWALTLNRKYEITAYGFNIPILSSYQNIVKVKGVK